MTTLNNESNILNRDNPVTNRISAIIQTPILLLTVIFCLFHTILIIIRPIFRKNRLNWFTINVCLTTLCLCLFLLLMDIQQLFDFWIIWSCRFIAFQMVMTTCQVMYSHCVFVVSRLMAVVYANNRIFRLNASLLILIVTGWFLSFLIASPFFSIDSFTCSASILSYILSYYTLITTIFLPIVIMALCNFRIFIFVKNSTRRVHATGNNGGQLSHARDAHLLKMMVASFIIFLIGWAPVYTTQLFDQTAKVSNIVNICFAIFPTLAMLYDMIMLIYNNHPVRLFIKQLILRQPQINIKHKVHQLNQQNHLAGGCG
ncbi:hypothetical protein I4U23_004180 [Adineta vaga]|nr:hypothetical protein I4U23_004180 [Adineta vaga]